MLIDVTVSIKMEVNKHFFLTVTSDTCPVPCPVPCALYCQSRMSVDSSILSLTASVYNRFDSIAALRSQSLLPFETKAKIQAGKPPRPRIRLCF